MNSVFLLVEFLDELVFGVTDAAKDADGRGRMRIK